MMPDYRLKNWRQGEVDAVILSIMVCVFLFIFTITHHFTMKEYFYGQFKSEYCYGPYNSQDQEAFHSQQTQSLPSSRYSTSKYNTGKYGNQSVPVP